MVNRISLVGMPAVGKSSVGRILAEKLGVPFVDTDESVERAAEKAVPRIFSEDGEQAFRNLETDAIRLATRAERAVLSCGGGAILREENVRLLKEFGTVIWLDASAQSLIARASGGAGRPLLADDAENKIIELASAREPFYRAVADIVVKTDGISAEKAAQAVWDALQNR